MFAFLSLLQGLLSSFVATLLPASPGSESQSSGLLTITDSRTKRCYKIPITHNAVRATAFRAISAKGSWSDPRVRFHDGLKIFDPGFQNTAVTESKITYIDGENGTIHYRQHPMNQLFENNDFEEVAFLLIFGSLPSHVEKMEFRRALGVEMTAPSCVIDVINAMPVGAPPFTLILAGLSAYAAFDADCKAVHTGEKQYLNDMKAVDHAIIRSISVTAVVVALVYCRRHQREFTRAEPDKPFITNILLMMGFVDHTTNRPDPKVVNCLEQLWILYADHEMANSTAALLHAASTLTDPVSCIIASTVSGFGPLHGGAIDLAYRTFERIGTRDKVPQLIADVKAKKLRLFGYGHRIYKTTDPRSKLMKSILTEKLSKEVEGNPLLAVVLEIDRIASQDEYFTSRNLKANADLYGTFIYSALGFEQEIIIPLAMISRTPGALAHWREAMAQPPRLWRPQQIFTGAVPKSK